MSLRLRPFCLASGRRAALLLQPGRAIGVRRRSSSTATTGPLRPLLCRLIQEAVVTVPRAMIAETIDLVAVLAGRGSARRLAELASVEGLGPDGDYRTSPVISDAITTLEPGDPE